jgi:YHS domain-containing protein
MLKPTTDASDLRDDGKRQERQTDLDCGVQIDPRTPDARAEQAGRAFCSVPCRDRFLADPARYARLANAPHRPSAARMPGEAAYTCPIHPAAGLDGAAPALTAAWRRSRSL